MKKTLLLFTLLCISFGTVQAQENKTSSKENKIGFKIGPNFSTIPDHTVSAKMRIGFHAGFFLETFIANDKLSANVEFLYSQQGARYQGSLPIPSPPFTSYTFTGDVDFKFNYINVPVTLRYYVAEDFGIDAGIQFGFLAGHKIKIQSSDLNLEAKNKLNDYLNKMDFGLVFGVGYQISKIQLNARYQLGMTGIIKKNKIYNNEDNGKHRVFQLGIGYIF